MVVVKKHKKYGQTDIQMDILIDYKLKNIKLASLVEKL